MESTAETVNQSNVREFQSNIDSELPIDDDANGISTVVNLKSDFDQPQTVLDISETVGTTVITEAFTEVTANVEQPSLTKKRICVNSEPRTGKRS
jgi:hypothetical protein